MTADASLAAAEAARRQEERKHAADAPVRDKLARLAAENDEDRLAELFREAFRGRYE